MNTPRDPKTLEAFKLKTQLNRTDLMIGRLETRVTGIQNEIKRMVTPKAAELAAKIMLKNKGAQV